MRGLQQFPSILLHRLPTCTFGEHACVRRPSPFVCAGCILQLGRVANRRGSSHGDERSAAIPKYPPAPPTNLFWESARVCAVRPFLLAGCTRQLGRFQSLLSPAPTGHERSVASRASFRLQPVLWERACVCSSSAPPFTRRLHSAALTGTHLAWFQTPLPGAYQG